MKNGYVTAVIATATGVIIALAGSYLLQAQEPMLREPAAQWAGAIAGWLVAWPWFRHNLTRIHGSRKTWHPIGIARRFGFIGYAVWIVVGMSAITAVRLYFRTG